MSFTITLPKNPVGPQIGGIQKWRPNLIKAAPTFIMLELRCLSKKSPTTLDIPTKFQKNKCSKQTYIALAKLFKDVLYHSREVKRMLTQYGSIPDVGLLNVLVQQLLNEIMQCRKTYVISTWKDESSEDTASTKPIISQMYRDVLDLSKKHQELGQRYKHVCSLCK